MSKNYGDEYRSWLNEIYRDCGCDGVTSWDDLPCWITGGREPADLMEENDPTMFRCGFADWTDGLRDDPPSCDDCGDDITDFDVGMDDEILCSVCKGEALDMKGVGQDE